MVGDWYLHIELRSIKENPDLLQKLRKKQTKSKQIKFFMILNRILDSRKRNSKIIVLHRLQSYGLADGQNLSILIEVLR